MPQPNGDGTCGLDKLALPFSRFITVFRRLLPFPPFTTVFPVFRKFSSQRSIVGTVARNQPLDKRINMFKAFNNIVGTPHPNPLPQWARGLRTVAAEPPIRRASGSWVGFCLLLAWVMSISRPVMAAEANASANAATEARLAAEVQYLASDELEGRGLDTKGINLAADYIAEQFRTIGLKTDLYDGTPFQKFTLTTSSKLGPAEKNTLTLVGPASRENKDAGKAPVESIPTEWKFNADFSPLAIGGSGKFDVPVVFAGYGITAPKLNYDDYAGIDAKGKAVIVLRHEPQQSDEHSAFDGTADSQYAPIARKVSNAYEHGAEVVLLVTDEVEVEKNIANAQKRLQQAIDQLDKVNEELKKLDQPTEKQRHEYAKKIDELTDQIRTRTKTLSEGDDPLFSFTRAGEGSEGHRMPVLHVHRSAIDPLMKAALGVDLAAPEKQIDDGPKPHSAELLGWRIQGETAVQRVETLVKNVIGVLEGDGPHADETIVIGAHYDHLGHGGAGSLAPGSTEIHHGADDNGSGTAALIEVARQLASREKKLPRRVVFIAFTGEERGLLGSARYVREPLVPLDKTIAMLNMDMVGRLVDDKLVIYGNGTATEFDQILNDLNEKFAFKITRHPEGFGPSDHSSFYAKEIPVLHFFTGTHSDYHRPTDTADKINAAGMRRIAEMVAETAVAIAEADQKPTYKEVKGRSQIARGGDRPYFGSIPDFSQDQPGYALTGVTKGGPAEKAGLKGGDIIVQLGESRIGNLDDFDSALRKFKAGDRVIVTVKRGNEELKFEVTLDLPR